MRLPIARGWILLALLIVCAAVTAAYDRQIKAPPHAGYVPADARLTMAAHDLPFAWDAFFALPSGRSLDHGLRRLRQNVERDIRLQTGIRPTPARWSTWLGRQVLAAEYDGTWGMCVRPGFLLRLANGVFNRGADAGTYHGIHFRWRDGFLLASEAEAWVEAAAAATVYAPGIPRATDTLVFRWNGGDATLRVDTGLPITIRLDADAPPPDAAVDSALPAFAPESFYAIATLSTTNVTLLEAILGRVDAAAATLPLWRMAATATRDTLDQWGTSLSQIAGQLRQGGALLLALHAVDTRTPAPVPVGALVQARPDSAPATHPLVDFVPNTEPLPGHWAGHDGTQTPLLGPALVLCTADTPAYWYTTSQEPAMHALAREELLSYPAGPDARLTLDWARAAQHGTALLRRAATWNMLPDSMVAELDHAWIPLVDAFAEWGTIDLQLSLRANTWHIEGGLDQRATDAP